MARVKIDFPDKASIYQTQVPLRVTDMNYGNHLGNDRILAIAQEARVQWLNSLNYSELDVAGAGLIMGDAMVVYKNEGLYGDLLTIEVFSNDITGVSFDLLFNITTLRNKQRITVAQVKTGMVTFDYSKKKVCPIPEVFKQQLH